MGKSKQHMQRMKRNHQALIMLGVRKYGSISRAQLSQLIGISPACVSGIVDELLNENVLVETGTVSGSRGRPQTLIELNPDGTPIIGAYLTWECICVVVANPAGKVLFSSRLDYDCGQISNEEMIKLLSDEVRRAAAAVDYDLRAIGCMGLAIGSSIDTMLGVLRNKEAAWDGMPIVSMLEKELGITVYAENDVRAAAMTDTWLGNDITSGNRLYITITKSLGCAFINENKILRGARDLSGRFSYMIINDSAPEGYKCLWQLATNVAFIRTIWPELAEKVLCPSISLSETDKLVHKGVNMALEGDHKAYAALCEVTRNMGIGLGNIISILDPQTVCIGGALIESSPAIVLDMIRRETLKHLLPDSIGVEIKPLLKFDEFILNGAIGLVTCRQFMELQTENHYSQTLHHMKLVSAEME